jgi:ATP-dependent Clp protease ATP-binding subunit ClpA
MINKFDNDFSPELNVIINEKCQEISKIQGIVLPKDIILCIMQEDSTVVKNIIQKYDIDKKSLLDELSLIAQNYNKTKRKLRNMQVSPNGRDVSTDYILQLSDKIVSKFGHSLIDIEHVIFAFLSYKGKNSMIVPVKNALQKFGLNEKDFRREFIMVPSEDKKQNQPNEIIGELLKTRQMKDQDFGALFERAKQNLLSFGYISNLNDKVLKSDDKFIGREEEIKKCIQILCRKKKRNVIVIGEPGTGKTALIEGIARKIVIGDVPEKFMNTEIYSVNMGNIVSGTKYRGQFEERMKVITQFVEYANKINKRIILFVDEIHVMVSAGSAEGSLNGSSILKPKLSSDEIQCIGATTLEDYKKHLTKDEAFARRFTTVWLDEPKKDEVLNIISQVKDEYENFHGVEVEDDAVEEIVYLSDRYIKDRFFPDKALDVLDESCSKVLIDNEEKVTVDIIEKIISERTGIPITAVKGEEKELLIKLETVLNEKVIGQSTPINEISKAIKKSRIGLKDENKPIGVFYFLVLLEPEKHFFQKHCQKFCLAITD